MYFNKFIGMFDSVFIHSEIILWNNMYNKNNDIGINFHLEPSMLQWDMFSM